MSNAKRRGGLRRRWLKNTLWIACVLGLACVLTVTAVFAGYLYSHMERDLRERVRLTSEIFSEYLNRGEETDFSQLCTEYVQQFEDRNGCILQFVDDKGMVVAASDGKSIGKWADTSEIEDTLTSRGVCTYLGEDSLAGERVMAVSGALVYSNGEIIGVFRMVLPTAATDTRIFLVAGIALAAFTAVIAVIVLTSMFYIRSISEPIGEINEKARRIAGGSYGIQIQGRYDDEIGELVDTINEMSAQISQNEKAQTEFISSLSHELRTPLTAITGWSETLLSDENLNADTHRGMNIILREAQRLTEMVIDLLDFTKIQDGRMTLNMEQADIRSEFEDTVFMYGSRLSQEGIQLRYLDNDDAFPPITCDPKRLRQVFLNILDNAAKHGGDSKQIDASIHNEGGEVLICIRDYGPGIPEDEIPLVKRKFYKGSSKARGSGIGLAVCDEIVEMHGGTLTLENAQGGGTLVTIQLPCAQ